VTDTVRALTVGAMRVAVLPDAHSLAVAAADAAAAAIRDAVRARATANVMFATGNSQLGFLDVLTRRRGVPWEKTTGFHMDEYLALADDHPASFRRYLRERLVARVPISQLHEIRGDAPDAAAECERYAGLLREHALDLCCLGIGENGHLAFNDPPDADFADPREVKVVELDDACRRQQVGEGHFPTIDAVPARAITVTIPALLRARSVLAIVPESRKAEPVRRALYGPESTDCPASILRRHAHVTLLLDVESAAGLDTP
jgi:glucosamine-6-phosphate deaminase